MVKREELGRLERLAASAYWATEPEFSRWLAQRENIELLNRELGLTIEPDSVEKAVGDFACDIFGQELDRKHPVVIENQYGRSDHDHLGKVTTYAAGLDAQTIIWMAESFREEHRAALDWLNRVSAPGVDFFGVEIQLLRIGDSPLAPKFNPISIPNGWQKTIGSGEAWII